LRRANSTFRAKHRTTDPMATNLG